MTRFGFRIDITGILNIVSYRVKHGISGSAGGVQPSFSPLFCSLRQSISGWKYSTMAEASALPVPHMTLRVSGQGLDAPIDSIAFRCAGLLRAVYRTAIQRHFVASSLAVIESKTLARGFVVSHIRKSGHPPSFLRFRGHIQRNGVANGRVEAVVRFPELPA